MRLIFVYIISFYSLTAFGQNGRITGNIAKQDKSLEFKYLTVLIQKRDSTFNWDIPDSLGNFIIIDILDGIYSLVIKQLGYRDAKTDSVAVLSGGATNLNLIYPPPCKFKYYKGKKPKCENGHRDQIIPIAYGLPRPKTMRRAEKGKVHLAGCLVTDCDPKYFCKIHKRELLKKHQSTTTPIR